jgi:MarR family transcriptional regulator, lower aerobic nicotinate degradation pathway regulator
VSERFVHQHLPYLLARASHALWRGFEPQLRAAGLNSLEWRVLATLSDGGPITVGRLALEVLAKQPTLTKSLDRLEAQGWVGRRADPADARRAQVVIKPAGQRKVRPLLEAARRHEAQRLRAMGLGDAAALREALKGLVRRFDASVPPEGAAAGLPGEPPTAPPSGEREEGHLPLRPAHDRADEQPLVHPGQRG